MVTSASCRPEQGAMNTMSWSVGEGWKAPPLPTGLVRAMSAEDLEEIQEQELGELEEEEEEETEEQTEKRSTVELEEEHDEEDENEQTSRQTDRQTEELTTAPRLPSIDGYLLGENIPADAWSVSRFCTDEATGKNYVLKTIPKTKKVDGAAVAMLRYLNHPGLVRVKDVRDSEDEYRVFHEVVTTGTLQAWLNEKGLLNESAAALLIRQLLEALQYLHSNGMVHYDIMPDSVYVSAEGSVKLSTCCGAVFNRDGLIATACMQRPQFVGPDVLLDKELGKEVDMWAVGILTFLILTSRMPYTDPRGNQYTFGNIVKGTMPHIDEWDSLSSSAKDFILLLLTVDSTSRLTAPDALKHAWILGTSSHT